MNILVIGVSGSGKSTIGKALSQSLRLPFFDGDDFHPKENVTKMAAGHPLNDKDRKPWLERLAELIRENNGLVLACSALKEEYRNILSAAGTITWVFLDGNAKLIQERLKDRKGHFMPAKLLESQFNDLQIPDNAIQVDISRSPDDIVSSVLEKLKN